MYSLSVWFSNLSQFTLVKPSTTGRANNYWDGLVKHLGTGKRYPRRNQLPELNKKVAWTQNSPKADPKYVSETGFRLNKFPNQNLSVSGSIWGNGFKYKHTYILTALLTNSDVSSTSFLHQNWKQLCYRFLLSAGAAIKSKFMLNSE